MNLLPCVLVAFGPQYPLSRLYPFAQQYEPTGCPSIQTHKKLDIHSLLLRAPIHVRHSRVEVRNCLRIPQHNPGFAQRNRDEERGSVCLRPLLIHERRILGVVEDQRVAIEERRVGRPAERCRGAAAAQTPPEEAQGEKHEGADENNRASAKLHHLLVREHRTLRLRRLLVAQEEQVSAWAIRRMYEAAEKLLIAVRCVP